ncbi:MAG: hypothetical protein F6J93_25750 [Oscillatoria sp. SIO1A7]|nr:hypothetical protein [Oscillatoria sp. SIO1A7]
MSETDLREVVTKITNLAKRLPERVLSVEKEYAQLATELSELKERLESLGKSPDSETDLDDGFVPLASDEVIKILAEDKRVAFAFSHSPIIESADFIQKLVDFVGSYSSNESIRDWVEGADCQVSRNHINGWEVGKVRLSLEFCPGKKSDRT